MEEFQDEGVAWPSYVDFLSTFVFVLFLFIGSMLYLQTGDLELSSFISRSGQYRDALRKDGIDHYVRGRMVIIPLRNQLKFANQQFILETEHMKYLRRVAASFHKAGDCRRIIVAGYADGVPYRTDPFGNWRLSTARAQNVLEFFYNCSDCGYGPEIKRKLILSGEGDTGSTPLSADEGARRVDIIIDYTDAAGR